MPFWHWLCQGAVSGQGHIQVDRVGRHASYRSDCPSTGSAGYDLQCGTVVANFCGNLTGGVLVIGGRTHFVGRRQVNPELESSQPPLFLFRHFRMDDATSCGHPLDTATFNDSAMACAIFVPDFSSQKVSDCFKPPMGVRRKSGDVVVGIVGLKKVQ